MVDPSVGVAQFRKRNDKEIEDKCDNDNADRVDLFEGQASKIEVGQEQDDPHKEHRATGRWRIICPGHETPACRIVRDDDQNEGTDPVNEKII